MLDISVLITKLEELGIPVEISRGKEVVLQNITDLPLIYVGYGTIHSGTSSQDLISCNEYEQIDQDSYQVFHIKIVSTSVDFASIWKQVNKLLAGWSPYVPDYEYSAFSHIEGGVMGEDNKKLWHLDLWKLSFPKISKL